MDWLTESLDLLNRGGGMVLRGALRLGLLALAVVVAYRWFRALLKNPVEILRGTLAVALALFIGFGSILLFPKYVFPVEEWETAVLWTVGWLLAYKVAVTVGGWKESSPSATSNTGAAE